MHVLKRQLHQKDKTRELQRKLYLAAKKKKNRRFHALYDRIYRGDVMWRAWKEVKSNKGIGGIDNKEIEDIEQQGVENLIQEIISELKEKRYNPSPVKRVYIPKSDGAKRALGIPTLKDRVVQQACKIVIEPIFEANFLENSYGFRPKRNGQQAARDIKESMVMNWYVTEVDIKGFFDNINHEMMMKILRKRISDKRVLKLIKKWMTAGVLENGNITKSKKGTPQGGVISPLLANIYLHVLDKIWEQKYCKFGKLYRYADDFVVISANNKSARQAHKAIIEIVGFLKLETNKEKTKIVNLNKEGFDFLGYHFRKGKSRRSGKIAPMMWPSKKSMNRIKENLREKINIRYLGTQLEGLIREKVNPLIRGWSEYFRIGNATKKLQQLDKYVNERLFKLYKRKYGRNIGKNIKGRYYKWRKTTGLVLFYKRGICGR